MEQSGDSLVTAEEIEVANIMLELSRLIFESESRPRFSFTWGAKRKRFTASKEEVAATSLPALKLSPPPCPPPPLPSNVVGSTYETEAPMGKVLTSSPATPLSFSPSESDEKPLPSKKKASVNNNLKKKKEQLLEIMEDFTRRNELLKKDIENKKWLLDQQKAQNLELKAKKQKLSQSLPKIEDPRLETSKSLNLEIELTQISMETENTTTTSTSQDYHHHKQQISTRVYQPPLIMDQTVSKSEMNKNFQYPFGRIISWLPLNNVGGLSKLHDNVCPLGLLDLNVSAKEALGSLGFSSLKSIDLEIATKARAAQARLKRKQICRSKNYNSACKARYPFR